MNKLGSYIFRVCIAALTLSIMSQCASPGSIQGGPKDETPPKVDSLASSPTPQVNFIKDDITITFDEWVKLEDPFDQIFISPPLEHRPTYTLRKRSLIISFDEEEELQDSTTYIINLGTSIKDITESNPLEDFQFVFSTGDELDSLGFSGTITDILTGEPVENASVMLYDNFADTAITTLPPAYFSRTGKDGRYKFGYLRPDTFQLIAYIDEDQDYRYNEESEPLGFVPEPIITSEINGSEIDFQLSIGEPPVYLDKRDTSIQSLVLLTFEQPVMDTARMKIITDPEVRHIDRLDQQVRIYYHPDSIPMTIIAENINGFRDTITIRQTETKKNFEEKNIEVTRINTTLLPKKPLRFRTNWPVEEIHPDLIEVIRNDSTIIQPDTVGHTFTQVELKYPLEADSSYRMTLLPGAIMMEDQLTHDTLEYNLKPIAEDQLSSLIITLVPDEDYDLPPQFILQLKEKDKLIQTIITDQVNETITFSELKPATYQLWVIRDENKNGIWDPARYPGRQPAEQIQKIDLDPLRVNWIQETEIQLK